MSIYTMWPTLQPTEYMPLTAGRIWRVQDDEHIHNVVPAGR